MPRGGRRSGRPGTQYPNRSDLAAGPRQAAQPVRAAPNQPYGARGAQEAAQQTMPLPQVTPLDAPTERPAEPVTAGLPSGPGPGPEALGMVGQPNEAADDLRALYQAFPNDDLRALLEEL